MDTDQDTPRGQKCSHLTQRPGLGTAQDFIRSPILWASLPELVHELQGHGKSSTASETNGPRRLRLCHGKPRRVPIPHQRRVIAKMLPAATGWQVAPSRAQAEQGDMDRRRLANGPRNVARVASIRHGRRHVRQVAQEPPVNPAQGARRRTAGAQMSFGASRPSRRDLMCGLRARTCGGPAIHS